MITQTTCTRLMLIRLATPLSLIVFFIVSIHSANGQTDQRQPKFPIGKKFVPADDPRDKDLRLPIIGKIKNGPDDESNNSDSKKGGGSAAAIDDGYDPAQAGQKNQSGHKNKGGKGSIRVSRSTKGGQPAPVMVGKPPRLPVIAVAKDFELPGKSTQQPVRPSRSNSNK